MVEVLALYRNQHQLGEEERAIIAQATVVTLLIHSLVRQETPVDNDHQDGAWKLKLRYGQIKTPYSHYSVIAEGIVGVLSDGFSCRPGSAFMGMKAWASSLDEAIDMICTIGRQIGFTVTGRIEIYKTEPEQPPGEIPEGYDIGFTPFDADRE